MARWMRDMLSLASCGGFFLSVLENRRIARLRIGKTQVYLQKYSVDFWEDGL